ncbi:hypothetical protein ACFQE5_18325 [Pseudonocardia hispaniensis]|uniref:Uncharacterized protein n=1 Tax=Pseudonocardia hispaniensis TaxID=904933 RepID=A0ABW1J5P5_9PSEU
MSTLLTAVGHVVAGGSLPDLALLVVLFPLLVSLVTGLADACRSVLGMLLVLGGGQLFMHEVMQVLAHPHPAGSATITWPVMLAMHAGATLVTGALIRDADRALLALFAALLRVLPRRLVPPPADRPLRTLPVPEPAAVGRCARAALGPLVLRAPPPMWV